MSVAAEAGGIAFLSGAGALAAWMILWVAVPDKTERPVAYGIFLVGCTVALVVGVATENSYRAANGTPYQYGSWDDDYWFDTKALAAHASSSGDLAVWKDTIAAVGSGSWHTAENYAVLLAWLYRWMSAVGFEPHSMYPRVVNALLLGLVAAGVYRLGRACGAGAGRAAVAGHVCALSPQLLFNAANIYRDLAIACGIVFASLGVVGLVTNSAPGGSRMRALGLWAVGLLTIAYLRDMYGAIGLGLTAASAVLAGRRRAAVLVGVIAALSLGGALLQFGMPEIISTDRQDQLMERREALTAGGGIVSRVLSLSGPLAVPGRLLIRTVAPVPFTGDTLPAQFESLGTMIWIVLVPMFVRRGVHSLRAGSWDRLAGARILALWASAFYVVNAAGTLQTRHAVSYIPVALALVACRTRARPGEDTVDLAVGILAATVVILVYWVPKLQTLL